jgi:hypothetical protein
MAFRRARTGPHDRPGSSYPYRLAAYPSRKLCEELGVFRFPFGPPANPQFSGSNRWTTEPQSGEGRKRNYSCQAGP